MGAQAGTLEGLLPDADLTLSLHWLSLRAEPNAPQLAQFSVLVTLKIGPFMLRCEFLTVQEDGGVPNHRRKTLCRCSLLMTPAAGDYPQRQGLRLDVERAARTCRFLVGDDVKVSYFSVVQRKVLTPNDFATLTAVEHYLLAFQHRYQTMAQPFRWTFTRADLHKLLAKLTAVRPAA